MALTTLSVCFDALVARELASVAGSVPQKKNDILLELGKRGIGAVAEGLPVALEDGKNKLARELLTIGSVCAGQLSVITPAPPTQVNTRGQQSLIVYCGDAILRCCGSAGLYLRFALVGPAYCRSGSRLVEGDPFGSRSASKKSQHARTKESLASNVALFGLFSIVSPFLLQLIERGSGRILLVATERPTSPRVSFPHLVSSASDAPQLMARAAGSLLARHSYPSVCAMVFPHVVGDMLSQGDSFSGDAKVSEAIERGKLFRGTPHALLRFVPSQLLT